jgi:predicted nucleic-acid-binding protein
VKVTADTNVLVRLIVRDDLQQLTKAKTELDAAETVCVATATLCELAWVLNRTYRHPGKNIAAAIRALLESANVMCNRAAIDAGLAVLDAGGDFADGVMAFDGRALGGDEFLSFDKKAVKLLKTQGVAARLLV